MARHPNRGRHWACLAALAYGAAAQDKVEYVDMYRALTRKGTQLEPYGMMSNNNLADAMGVLRYIMQEVVPEHIQADQDVRKERKYGINAIARYKMQIRNPDALLNDIDRQAVPNYARFSAFDYGILTADVNLPDVVELGDIVGAARENAGQIAFKQDGFWYSVTGYCPNLPWNCINPFPGCTATQPTQVPARCLGTGCPGKRQDPPAVCSTTYANFVDTTSKEGLATCCLHYKVDKAKVIAGGLCEYGKSPTGAPGCVYQYQNLTEQDYVSLDTLVGFSSLKCGAAGDRNCADWLDWRQNCYDPQNIYKRRFKKTVLPNNEWQVEVEATTYCTEYDVHPYCEDTPAVCNDPKCQALPVDQREIGLPFWQGKCDAVANQRKAEAIVNALTGNALAGRHLLADPEVTKKSPPCLDPSAAKSQCRANPNGGTYCTRSQSHVCSLCFIPGTAVAYSVPQEHAPCPLNLFSEVPAVQMAADTKCKSTLPSDICCLYKIPGFACTGDDNPATATLDVDGFMLVRARQNTTDMATFARRWAEANGRRVTNQVWLAEEAYWWWDVLPPKDNTAALWASTSAQILSSKAVEVVTTTTTSTTTVTTVTGPATTGAGGSTTKPGTTSAPAKGSPVVGIVIGVIVALVALVAIAYFVLSRRAREPGFRLQVDEAASYQMSARL